MRWKILTVNRQAFGRFFTIVACNSWGPKLDYGRHRWQRNHVHRLQCGLSFGSPREIWLQSTAISNRLDLLFIPRLTFVIAIYFVPIQILCLATMSRIYNDLFSKRRNRDIEMNGLQWKNKASCGWAPATNHCIASRIFFFVGSCRGSGASSVRMTMSSFLYPQRPKGSYINWN